MAIASCSVKIISRGKGRSAVAAAAYRAGQEMQNEYDGLAHNYTRKSGIIYTDILTPAGAPDWAHNRQQLWNRVEETERRKDAQLAREVMIALPRELSPPQNIEVARAYAQTFVHQGMIADVAVHDGQDGNPHAHIMLALRQLKGDSFGKKCREWNSTEKLIEWREQYADLTNRYLERFGHDGRIDARSYSDQGIDLIPTVHLGPHAHRMEQRGIPTERGDMNREIEKDNQQIREIVKEITLLELEREHLQSAEVNLVEHYQKTKEEIRKTAEELANLLTEKGRDILTEEQRHIEDALRQLQKQTQAHKPPAPHAPVDEPSPQPQLSFDEIYEVPLPPPQLHPEQTGPQERSAPPKRPPPLRRYHEDRHLAGERLRQSTQGHRTIAQRTLTGEEKQQPKSEYDRVYDEPPTHQEQEPKTPSHAAPRHAAPHRKVRDSEFDRLYDEPIGGSNKHREHDPNHTRHDREK